ncbi:MAG: hypothetical protein CBC35_05675 [Planctomycetes bacterium TMED75]|nr:gamma-glutamylcyclotransferase [Planctomycetaceae bacterium]OUU93420.1 MAG: hypothetical protein CBC35_05675 [Planctomycetes bacterium TMED75]
MSVNYFAYGANLDCRAMLGRCPNAQVLDRASLADHRVVSMREGWLSITPAEGEQTEGLLWKLREEHLVALDLYEEVDQGLYVHETRRVDPQQGDPIDALVYVGANSGPGLLHAEYAERVAAAARRELGEAAASRIEALSEAWSSNDH